MDYQYQVELQVFKEEIKELVLRDIHKFHGKFSLLIDVKVCSMEELEDEYLQQQNFLWDILLMHGKQSMKKWLVTQQDIEVMYSTKFLLWCDDCSDDSQSQKQQRETSPASPKRATKEMEVDTICAELKEYYARRITVNHNFVSGPE